MSLPRATLIQLKQIGAPVSEFGVDNGGTKQLER